MPSRIKEKILLKKDFNMKSGGWVPLDKGLMTELPKDRPYTAIEAVFSMQLDYDKGNKVTVSGYADLWRWSRAKVRRFIKKLGIIIQYPKDTAKKKNQKGFVLAMIFSFSS